MPTRRMIDPAFWRSESVAKLTRDQRLLFIGLISNADDQGRLRGHPALIRSDVYPYDDIDLDVICADLGAIEQAGSIIVYEINGKRHIQIVNWWKYQNPQWAYPSDVPPPDGWRDRLRYRQGGEVKTDNWDGDGGLPEALAKALPKDDVTTDDADRWPRRVSVSSSNKGSNSMEQTATPGAGAPTPKPPPDTGKKSKPSTPEAVKVFRSVVHRYPAKSWYSEIDSTVGADDAALELWGKVAHAWVGLGWNPTNVKGMLECYRNGEIPGAGNGRAGSGKRTIVDENLEMLEAWVQEGR